ncbi:MAG: hypothetical protein IKE28_08495 [Solobacterium sp.]|nr:hypothetical protein [Solobacterium sp.]
MKHKKFVALAMALSLLTTGCGQEDSQTTYQFDGISVTLSGKMNEIVSQRAGFSIQYDSVFTANEDPEDGIYIYTAYDGSIPYVMVDYYDSPRATIEEYQEFNRESMENRYGEDLIELSELKEYTFGDKKLTGFEYTFRQGDGRTNALWICEPIGTGFSEYIIKYMDPQKSITMDAFEAIHRSFKLPDEAASADSKAEQKTESSSAAALQIEPTYAQKLEQTLKQKEFGGAFTINIPDNWVVTTGGYNMHLWIRAYDPADPTLQVFSLLKADMMLKNYNAKSYYQKAYQMDGSPALASWAEAVVLENPTLEEFFKNKYADYCNYCSKWVSAYTGFDYPQIGSFESIESWDITDNLFASVALDDKAIHAQFTETLSQKKAEGMFTGSVVNLLTMMDPGYDCGVYGIYSLAGITAPYGMLNEYSTVLAKILGSIQYTDAFLQAVASEENTTIQNARQINQMMQESMNIVTNGWNSRQKTYDILSQEYSDSTMGFDRYLDTETNEVYRVELGALDHYDGSRYQKIEQGSNYYTEPISGYIYN